MMSGKGLNLFDECAAECVYTYVPSGWNSVPLLPEGTIKCTHLAP